MRCVVVGRWWDEKPRRASGVTFLVSAGQTRPPPRVISVLSAQSLGSGYPNVFLKTVKRFLTPMLLPLSDGSRPGVGVTVFSVLLFDCLGAEGGKHTVFLQASS